MTFEEMRRELGMPARLVYDVKAMSKVTGIPTRTLRDEMSAGRLRYFLPDGRRKGRVVKPEWVDAWIKEGSR